MIPGPSKSPRHGWWRANKQHPPPTMGPCSKPAQSGADSGTRKTSSGHKSRRGAWHRRPLCNASQNNLTQSSTSCSERATVVGSAHTDVVDEGVLKGAPSLAASTAYAAPIRKRRKSSVHPFSQQGSPFFGRVLCPGDKACKPDPARTRQHGEITKSGKKEGRKEAEGRRRSEAGPVAPKVPRRGSKARVALLKALAAVIKACGDVESTRRYGEAAETGPARTLAVPGVHRPQRGAGAGRCAGNGAPHSSPINYILHTLPGYLDTSRVPKIQQESRPRHSRAGSVPPQKSELPPSLLRTGQEECTARLHSGRGGRKTSSGACELAGDEDRAPHNGHDRSMTRAASSARTECAREGSRAAGERERRMAPRTENGPARTLAARGAARRCWSEPAPHARIGGVRVWDIDALWTCRASEASGGWNVVAIRKGVCSGDLARARSPGPGAVQTIRTDGDGSTSIDQGHSDPGARVGSTASACSGVVCPLRTCADDVNARASARRKLRRPLERWVDDVSGDTGGAYADGGVLRGSALLGVVSAERERRRSAAALQRGTFAERGSRRRQMKRVPLHASPDAVGRAKCAEHSRVPVASYAGVGAKSRCRSWENQLHAPTGNAVTSRPYAVVLGVRYVRRERGRRASHSLSGRPESDEVRCSVPQRQGELARAATQARGVRTCTWTRSRVWLGQRIVAVGDKLRGWLRPTPGDVVAQGGRVVHARRVEDTPWGAPKAAPQLLGFAVSSRQRYALRSSLSPLPSLSSSLPPPGRFFAAKRRQLVGAIARVTWRTIARACVPLSPRRGRGEAPKWGQPASRAVGEALQGCGARAGPFADADGAALWYSVVCTRPLAVVSAADNDPARVLAAWGVHEPQLGKGGVGGQLRAQIPRVGLEKLREGAMLCKPAHAWPRSCSGSATWQRARDKGARAVAMHVRTCTGVILAWRRAERRAQTRRKGGAPAPRDAVTPGGRSDKWASQLRAHSCVESLREQGLQLGAACGWSGDRRSATGRGRRERALAESAPHLREERPGARTGSAGRSWMQTAAALLVSRTPGSNAVDARCRRGAGVRNVHVPWAGARFQAQGETDAIHRGASSEETCPLSTRACGAESADPGAWAAIRRRGIHESGAEMQQSSLQVARRTR
ncbi:hypothetical protein DFH08DRAFT_1046600 [Mycena albidolilacea]|uniref:Uncharacterized protein n=1 Tax=Mycena albidolilacea TaxID=1033008 RepID=A0AAD6Z7B0_9AGAR|nr:hypothetical protein DFH08DRAFT_1046600 [Mycena albidolilacea]